jgi:hypothetical protein
MAGLAEIEVVGCDEGCEHVWGEERVVKVGRNDDDFNERTKDIYGKYSANHDYAATQPKEAHTGQYCQLCGGWRGSLGLEPTVDAYVGHMVLIARALWRVLRGDGSFLLNLGDSYGTGGSGQNFSSNTHGTLHSTKEEGGYGHIRQGGIKGMQKQLLGIPWRVALALQADGWYLRSAPPWIKASAMPESVRDRATTAHEFWFQLAKSKRYYWDAEAVRQSPANYERKGGTAPYTANGSATHGIGSDSLHQMAPAGRNRRTSDIWNESLDARIAFYRDQLAHLEHVKEHGGILLDEGGDPLGLHINTQGYKGAHFATFGEKLIMPLIKAGTSAKGCCPECGSPWRRVTDRKGHPSLATGGLDPQGVGSLRDENGKIHWGDQHPEKNPDRWTPTITTTGWTPTCDCWKAACEKRGMSYADDYEHMNYIDSWLPELAPIPCTVIDPFTGSGTVPAVARRLGRKWIGIELNREYCDDHIIPRLSEPLFEWAEEQEAAPMIEQGELFTL